MRRVFILVALLCSHIALLPSHAQEPPKASQDSDQSVQTAPALADAEAAIANSDWKTAGAKLDAYLATHSNDARALFDAGYAADHQDQLDGAAGFYRRAIEADPNSFESHLALGLLLARQGKKMSTRQAVSRRVSQTGERAGRAPHHLVASSYSFLAILFQSQS